MIDVLEPKTGSAFGAEKERENKENDGDKCQRDLSKHQHTRYHNDQ